MLHLTGMGDLKPLTPERKRLVRNIALLFFVLCAASAQAAPPPDLPGVGLDKLVWGMSADKVREIYPVIGRNPPPMDGILLLEDTSLRTGGYVLAGCRYTVQFSVGYGAQASAAPSDAAKGIRAATFTLDPGQPETCVVGAVDSFHGVFGKSVYDTAPPGQTREWRTDRTDIKAGPGFDHRKVAAFTITFHDRRQSPLIHWQ